MSYFTNGWEQHRKMGSDEGCVGWRVGWGGLLEQTVTESPAFGGAFLPAKQQNEIPSTGWVPGRFSASTSESWDVSWKDGDDKPKLIHTGGDYK